jgi:hypothetical protein
MNWKILILSNPMKPEPMSSLVQTRRSDLRCWFECRLLEIIDILRYTVTLTSYICLGICRFFNRDMLFALLFGGIIYLYFLL